MKLGNKVYLPMQIETKTYQIWKGYSSGEIHYVTQGNKLRMKEYSYKYNII